MNPKQRALEKQAVLEAERARKAAEEIERKEAAEWSVGAKSNAKAKALEDKEAEKMRKAAELASLMAQEESELSGVKSVKKTKKKGKDDFDLLNAALAAAPKSKAQKDAEVKKKQQEERLKAEQAARELKEARLKVEQDEIQKAAKRGIVMNHTDELMIPINNRLDEDDDEDGYQDISGMDHAISALSMGGTSAETTNDKVLYKQFYSSQLPLVKEQNPGLKLSQYKERIFEMWQQSPDNPRRQR